ncbi:MAG TPA: SRPBCC family protein [Rhizobacter sp.]|nr:SRPBCC family protein [Rhizobacter sp.]
MFKTLALAVVVLIAAVLIFAATKPDSFSVQRSATIKAPPEKIFPLINDFHQWPAWSPWERLDPAMQRTHGGPPAGTGATYAWVGNNKVGEGRMEIQESAPSSKVSIKLDFLKPFEAHNTADFTLHPQGDSTQVTWVMHGPAPYVTKLMTVFMSMDAMVGKDFEAGLANMKAAVEK